MALDGTFPTTDEKGDDGAAGLEGLFGRGAPERAFRCAAPFAFSRGNPELLPLAGAEAGSEAPPVIVERDGVPYIDGAACSRGDGAKAALNGDFARLAEAVMRKGKR